MGGRTSGTRPKGSGIPAGGYVHKPSRVRAPITKDTQPMPEAKSQGRADAATLRELLSPYKAQIVQTWVDVATDATAPHSARVAAANAIADRLEGAAKQTVDVTQKDERTAEQLERDVRAKMALVGLMNGPGNASNH